jgi:hypothetical protein
MDTVKVNLAYKDEHRIFPLGPMKEANLRHPSSRNLSRNEIQTENHHAQTVSS